MQCVKAAYFERSFHRRVTVNERRDKRLLRCESCLELVRFELPGNHQRLFTGPPPAGWGKRLSPAEPAASWESVQSAVTDLCRLISFPFFLYYSSVMAIRVTKTREVMAAPERRSSVWALAGVVNSMRQKRALPVGWSGLGSGIECLGQRLAEEITRSAETLQQADALFSADAEAVLAPAAAAVLIHECVGHLVEATAKPADSIPLGFRIASEMLTVIDDPMAEGGPSRDEYDNDNVRSIGPTTVVSQGIVVGLLHSAETAKAFCMLPTANGRAASAWHRSIPRMTNLCCLGGSTREAEMIACIRDGIYIRRLANGTNNGWKVEARIILAERIRDGRLTGKFLTEGNIREKPTVLRKVIGVGNNPVFHSNAMCGKAGQLLFNVGTSAPAIHLSRLRITR